MPADRAILDDELREAMVAHVMQRDQMTKEGARSIVNAMPPASLVRLEMEIRERSAPAFTSDYNPYS